MRTWSSVRAIALTTLMAVACDAQQHLLDLRSYEVTEDGASWLRFEAPECARCKGEKRLPCTACKAGEHEFASRCKTCNKRKAMTCGQCTGKGRALDPLAQMPCRRCEGHGAVRCGLCRGLGVLVVSTSQRPCHGCSRKGGHKCVVCAGKGAVDLEDAGGARLESATREQLEDALTELNEHWRAIAAKRTEFTAALRRSDREALERLHETALQDASELFPQFAKEPDAVAEIIEGLTNKSGTRYFAFGPTVTPTAIFRDSIDAAYETLRYQRWALERCLQRVSADEQQRAKKK